MSSKNTKKILKNFIILILIFSLILFFTIWSFFSDFKNKNEEYSKTYYELTVNNLNEQIKEKILLFDKESLEKIYTDIKNNNYIKDIKIKQNRYFFNKDTVLFQTKSFNDSSWNLTNVTVDVKYGEIKKLAGSSYYEFLPSPSFNKNENLVIRFQLFKNSEIKNFIIFVDLNLLSSIGTEDIFEPNHVLYDSFSTLKVDENIKKEFRIDNIPFGTIEYIRDEYFVKNEISNYLIKLIVYSVVIFLSMLVSIIYYQKYLKKKYLLRPLVYLDTIVSNIAESKFSNINVNKFSNIKNYNNLLKNISKLSTKMASLTNELNINKETLERNLLTDNLTGLYDKKMFDIDMKSMFVYSGDGYIFSLKIGKLSEIIKLNGSVNTDNFIISYVNIVENVINKIKNKNIDFYRFYGSEFVIIARSFHYSDALTFSKDVLSKLIEEISKNYKIPENIFHIAGTPFDIYGTIDTIMQSLETAYKELVDKNKNGSIVIQESEIKRQVDELESKVKLIVEGSNFSIDFIFDSYSLDEKLMIRELRPLLRDETGSLIPIGSFIAISEKLSLNQIFDENVILKAVKFIETKEIDYKIAINLSIKTISNIQFIEFIENLVKEKPEIMKHLLFSITSYSASAYKTEFEKFTKYMNKLNVEILMKRFKTKEYPFEELSLLKIDYIKIDRDLTQGVHNDLVKKHRVKNIVVFAELNDIKLLAENVESDNDYNYLSKFDLFAINR